MKHFFYAYDEQKCRNGILNRLFDEIFCNTTNMEERLKVLYDAADIIRDIRFEKKDNETENVMQKITAEMEKNSAYWQKYKEEDTASDKNDNSDKKIERYRIILLDHLWMYAEQQYKKFEADTHHLFRENLAEDDQKYEACICRILYHLTRGNICLRISQCYFEVYDLENSELWADRAMEIFWHGKIAARNLLDSSICSDKKKADLYLRLIKLNLAKYYRDYARKNRRSDFDAALDEFKWTRHRVEEKIKDDNCPDTRRQYGLIWMDAILNIAYIHRQRYQAAAAEKEILFFYHCLKNQLETKDSAFKNKTVERDSFPELISWANKLLSGYKAEDCKKIFNIDLPDLSEESFEICNNLNEYDRRRYFLLIMLEFGRVFRALHDVENYARSAAMSVIADKWSCQMDRRMVLDKTDRKEYEPGNNLDALIIFSNSLRKYIKYGDKNGNDFADGLIITINNKDAYKFTLRKPYRSKQGINALIRKLDDFAGKGHLSSKEEVIKWCCFYLQNSKNLDILKDTVEEINIKENYLKGTELNHQLYFLKGLFYVRSGKYRKAIRIFKNLTAPENKATQYIRFATIGLKARYLLATCYMALAEYSKAEKLLEKLRDTLENARKKRTFPEDPERSDSEPDGRIEVDLGYCYMQKGEYQKAINIYKNIYGDGKDSNNPEFNLMQMKRQHRIMGLNNYAASCILSADEESESLTLEEKMETARRIFIYLNSDKMVNTGEKKEDQNHDDPETSLLKGYYTICTGADPEGEELNENVLQAYRKSFKESDFQCDRIPPYLMAHKYFCDACRASEAFSARYELMDEKGSGDRGKYRNEVERISAYLVNLVKIARLNNMLEESERTDLLKRLTVTQKEYLTHSKHDLNRIMISFPKEYQISLKAAILLAEWLLFMEKSEGTDKTEMIKQLYRSFSYLTIYEERGAKVFNNLKDNRKFRLFTADERGKLLALLLSMYHPVKNIKEECCFTITHRERVKSLVHYTSMGTLKSMLNDKCPRFRINNCGYMNDVFEGTVFLKIIEQAFDDKADLKKRNLINTYFPQLRRSHDDRVPAASNVYIGSLSVRADSFHMWSVYAEKETGCNFEFGKDFFDIKGTPYYPRALRNYLISRYTDEDYPLYIVQYIDVGNGRETTEKEEKVLSGEKDRVRTCGTEAISYSRLMQLVNQICERWKELDSYLLDISGNHSTDRNEAIYAFTADRLNEIRFLFKDVNYEFEGEVRVVYTDATDGKEAKTDASINVPRVYVNLDRELEGLTVRLGSRIEDATVDKYVTWLKHTNRVERVGLARQNRYTI